MYYAGMVDNAYDWEGEVNQRTILWAMIGILAVAGIALLNGIAFHAVGIWRNWNFEGIIDHVQDRWLVAAVFAVAFLTGPWILWRLFAKWRADRRQGFPLDEDHQ